MHKAIDKRISEETFKVKRNLDKRSVDIRKEFESDLDELTNKLLSLSDHLESSHQSQNGNGDGRDHISPESSGETVSCKVNSLFKDGLQLKGFEVHLAERKRLFNESKPGVFIAKMKSMEDKKKVLTKAFLRDNRRYQNVFIYSDQRREERLMSANFRPLISAFKIGVRGMRIISDQNRPDFESMEDDQLRPIYISTIQEEYLCSLFTSFELVQTGRCTDVL